MLKVCIGCTLAKALSEFYAHKRMADGTLNKCKDCIKLAVKANRLANLERIRAYDRARGKAPEKLKKLTVNTRRWRHSHPGRSKAHSAVMRALRAGELLRQPCEVCGNGIVHAHHDDYSKPLEVRWLCAVHHRQHHVALEALVPKGHS